MAPGLLAAALSYVIWGLFPLYFHALAGMDAFAIVLHRSLWSFVFVWSLLLAMRSSAGSLTDTGTVTDGHDVLVSRHLHSENGVGIQAC